MTISLVSMNCNTMLYFISSLPNFAEADGRVKPIKYGEWHGDLKVDKEKIMLSGCSNSVRQNLISNLHA